MDVPSPRLTSDEAERQLVAAAERHSEAVALMGESGRPEAGQHVAAKAVDRAVRLVCFALRRGAEAGIAAGTAAAVASIARLDELAQEILAGVLDTPDPTPSADELDELHARLASEWIAWRTARIPS
jgi:hypothetical protein